MPDVRGLDATSAARATSYRPVRPLRSSARPGRPGPRRFRRAALAAVLAVVAGVAGAASTATAQDDGPTAEEYGLGVTVGFGGLGAPLGWTPVEVRLAPDRPLRATLAVRSQPFSGTTAAEEVVAVDVGGGSTKAYRFVVPPGDIGVTVQQDGRGPLRATVQQARVPGFLVGRLGGADGGPPLRDDALGATGAWVGVAAEWLELPRALDSLGGLVADVAVVGDLPAASRAALAAEVAAGLDLVLVSGPGAVDAAELGLPGALLAQVAADGTVEADGDTPALALGEEIGAPAATAAAAPPARSVAVLAQAGRGRMTVTSVRPGEDGDAALAEQGRFWSRLVGARGPLREAAANASLANAPFRLSELFAASGGGAPRIPWLLGFLVAYVAVVGPLNALVLARARRRELAWVTVPVVTAVFTAAGFVAAGGGGAAEAATSLGRAVWWLDGAGREEVVAAVRAGSDGERTIALRDGGWAVRPLSDAASAGRVVRGDGTRVTMELRALQVGGVLAERPVTEPAPLAVTARTAAAGVVVAVRNTSTEPVTGLEVRAATASRRVGTLAPGAEAEVVLDEDELPGVDPYAWEQVSGNPPPPGQARGPDAFELLLRPDVLDGVPGVAWAVGSREGGGGDVLAGRDPATEPTGTLIAVGAPILPDAEGRLSAFAWERGAFVQEGQAARGPLHVDGAREVPVRLRAPLAAAALHRVHPALDGAGFGPPPRWDVWSAADGVWLPLDELLDADGAIPAERVLSPTGDLYVRASGDLFPLDLSTVSASTVPPAGAS